jgi:parallel beta-helix repeat protein
MGSGGLILKRGLIGDYFLKFASISLVITLLLLSADAGSARTVYVEPGNSIQDSVNNSTTGDIIVVKAGAYQENITVNVSGVTVTSDPSSGSVLLRSPDGNSSVFQIEADNVTIRGFNITGSGEAGNVPEISEGAGCPPSGICLKHANNCTIERNNLSENRYGIYLQESMNNTLSQNNLSGNGIWLDEGCSENILLNNVIEKGNIILGAHCWNNTILQNRLSNGEGISIACCGGNYLVSRNSIMNCSTGIDIYDVQARTVLSNNRIMNCNYGIVLDSVFDSRIYNNTISNASTGIYFREECHSNNLYSNVITSSKQSGIYLLDNSADNSIYNNYFNNTITARVENSVSNSWNTTKKKSTNIVKGPYLGGNFWADPHGTGFSQTAEDSNSDGISDRLYRVNGSDIDYLPLVINSSEPRDELE